MKIFRQRNNYSGIESFANEALVFQACAIQTTIKKAMVNPSDEFGVFGYDYYQILAYATEQPNEVFYKKDLDTLYTKSSFLAIFRFYVGSQIRYRIHMKLPTPLNVILNPSQKYFLENYLKNKLEGFVPDENGYRTGEINALSAFNIELQKFLSGNGVVPTNLTGWDKLEMPAGTKVIVENGTPSGNARIDETSNIIKFLVNGSTKELLSGDLLNNDDTFKIGSYVFDIYYSLRTSLDNSGFDNPRSDNRSYMNIFAQKQDTSPYYDLYIKVITEIDFQTANLIFDDQYDAKLSEYGYSLSDDDISGGENTIDQLEKRESQSLSPFPIGKKYMETHPNIAPISAIACGALDGLLGNVEVLYELGKFAVKSTVNSYVKKANYYKELAKAAAKGDWLKK